MRQNIKIQIYHIHFYVGVNIMTEYKDIKNNTFKILQRTASEGGAKIYTEEEILEALYKIFADN